MAACVNALKQIEFKAIKPSGSYQQEWTDGAFATIGLNLRTSDLPVQFDVNPVIGVRHVEFDRVMHELSSDLPPDPLPSIRGPLGYLMPERKFHSWIFREGDNLDVTAQGMVDAVTEYGNPFFDKYSNWSNFVSDVDSTNDIMLNIKAQIIPVAWALSGDVAKAWKFVSAELGRISHGQDPYSVAYRNFSDNFQQKFRT